MLKKNLESFHTIKRLTIEQIYDKALLSQEERQFLERYSDIINERLIYYNGYWLYDSPELNKNNIIKYIAGFLLKLNSEIFIGDIRDVVKHLFTESMAFDCYVNGFSYGVRSKSNNFYDVLFELKLMDFFISRNFKVDYTRTRLSSGKDAEYYLFNDAFGFYAEAKNLNTNDIDNIILEIYLIWIWKTEDLVCFI